MTLGRGSVMVLGDETKGNNARKGKIRKGNMRWKERSEKRKRKER